MAGLKDTDTQTRLKRDFQHKNRGTWHGFCQCVGGLKKECTVSTLWPWNLSWLKTYWPKGPVLHRSCFAVGFWLSFLRIFVNICWPLRRTFCWMCWWTIFGLAMRDLEIKLCHSLDETIPRRKLFRIRSVVDDLTTVFWVMCSHSNGLMINVVFCCFDRFCECVSSLEMRFLGVYGLLCLKEQQPWMMLCC